MPRILSLGLSLLLGLPAALSEPTSITITVKDYQSFEQGAQTLYRLNNPDSSDEEFQAEFRDFLDLSLELGLLEGYDRERPWQYVTWLVSIEPTHFVTSTCIPVDDYGALRKAFLKWRSENGLTDDIEISRDGDYAKLWYGDSLNDEDPDPALRKWHDDRDPTKIPTPHGVMDISFKLGKDLRTEIQSLLAMSQMMSTQYFENLPQEDLPGFDPKAMANLLNYQVSLFQTVVKGLDTLVISLGLSADAFVLEQRIKARSESELASCLRSPGADLTPMVATLDPSATLRLAAQWGEESKIKSALKELSVLSMKLSEDYATEDSVKEFEQLMEKLLPQRIAGSITAGEPLSFAYTYYYPDFELNDFRQAMARLVKSLQPMTGVDKPFRQCAWQPDFEVVDGTPVDRFLTVLNLEHDWYRLQTPEQTQALGRLWDEGVMDIRLARQGDYLFMGTVGEIEKILDRVPAAEPPALGLNRNTVLYASISPFEFSDWFSLFLGEKLFEARNPDSEGTDIDFRVDFLGDRGYSRVALPLKLLKLLYEE